MNTTFKTRIVKIGNSQGIRVPKALLEQAGLGTEVKLDVQPDQIIIRSAHPRRHGWQEQFSAMAAQGDDRLLDDAIPTDWDAQPWEWAH